jgi:hypothetical protein
MGLKEKFITYCELQRSARDYRERLGAEDKQTVAAYDKANAAKREVLRLIEELENE